MKSRRLLPALLLLSALPVSAQQPDAPAAAASAPRPEKGSDLSDQEKMSRSSEHLGAMRKLLSEVLKKLEQARDSKDVVKLNCVNEKLTQIKGLIRIAEQADIALQEAIAKREASSGQHEFTKVDIANDKVRQLRAEAEECIGLSVFEVGQTEVKVEVPQDLPSLDPTKPTPISPVIVRPPPASPTG
jgi:hypothetical protein